MPSSTPCCWPAVAGLVDVLSRKRAQEAAGAVAVSKKRILPNRRQCDPASVYTVDEKVLASGGFGSVRKVTDATSGRQRIMKTINTTAVSDKAALTQELNIQADLDHPYLCKLFDTFDASSQIHIVMEYCQGGDLESALVENIFFGEREAQYLMLQLMRAVCYMHSQGVAHLDLKPENALLRRRGVPLMKNTIKIVDFGFAQYFKHGEHSLTKKCGTPWYIAPEIWNEEVVFFNEKCDIYSCGVMMYQFLSGETPFDADSVDDIGKLAMQGALAFEGDAWEKVTNAARFSIMQLCRVDPERRCSAEDFLSSPWLNKALVPPMPAVEDDSGAARMLLQRMRTFRKPCRLRRAAGYHVAMSLPDSEQVSMLRTMFNSMDQSGAGRVTLAQLEAGLSTLGERCKDIMATFREMDETDKLNGYLEWTEFLSAMAGQRFSDLDVAVLGTRSACWEAFRAIDVDGDEKLSASEIRSLLEHKEKGPVSHDEARSVLASAGLGDVEGHMSFDEFHNMMVGLTRSEYANTDMLTCRLPREHSVNSPCSEDFDFQYGFQGSHL